MTLCVLGQPFPTKTSQAGGRLAGRRCNIEKCHREERSPQPDRPAAPVDDDAERLRS